MIINSVTDLIGNTPTLLIPQHIHGVHGLTLYVKLEMFNPFGSVKDRVGWSLIKDELTSIKSKKQNVIEVSSGNTAKALAAICGMHGIRIKTLTNRVKVPEVKDILLLLGADVEELPGNSECPDPSDPNNPLVYLEREIAKSGDTIFHPNQYVNENNPQAHENSTAREIVTDVPNIDYLFGGLGTAGSTVGVGRFLRRINSKIQVVGVVSRSDDFLPGIRRRDEMHEVGIFDPIFYDLILDVDSGSALEGMRTLMRSCGILCGPSTGGTYAALLNHFKNYPLSEDKTAVFFACDRVEWYLSYIKRRKSEWFKSSGAITKASTSLTLEELESVPEETAQSLEGLRESGASLLIDIRPPSAFEAARVSGSINMVEEHLEETLRTTSPFDPQTKVVIICRVGTLSRKIAALLLRYNVDARFLAGGLLAWQKSGRKLTYGKACLR